MFKVFLLDANNDNAIIPRVGEQFKVNNDVGKCVRVDYKGDCIYRCVMKCEEQVDSQRSLKEVDEHISTLKMQLSKLEDERETIFKLQRDDAWEKVVNAIQEYLTISSKIGIYCEGEFCFEDLNFSEVGEIK